MFLFFIRVSPYEMPRAPGEEVFLVRPNPGAGGSHRSMPSPCCSTSVLSFTKVIEFGYVTLFASAFPLAAVVSLVSRWTAVLGRSRLQDFPTAKAGFGELNKLPQ